MSDQITAGPETDALIAEQIFRIRPSEVPGRHPRYTTDIAGAWPVFQWLIDMMGPEVTVVLGFDQELDRWLCGPQAELPAVALGETAPLAICRAALAAHAKYVQPARDHLKLEE